MPIGELGKDYVILKGRGGREYQNGATIEADKLVHLSVNFGRTTICGHAVKAFMLTYDDVDINCPECIKILRMEYEEPHPKS